MRGCAQNQHPQLLLSVASGNSQRSPNNLLQKCVATWLFHRNVSHSALRGRCSRGNGSGAASFRAPPGARGRSCGSIACGHGDGAAPCSLSLWQARVTVWRYSGYFEERAVVYRFSLFPLHKYKPRSAGRRGQHGNALRATLVRKASAQRVSKEQKLPQKQTKAHLIPPRQGLTGGAGRAAASSCISTHLDLFPLSVSSSCCSGWTQLLAHGPWQPRPPALPSGVPEPTPPSSPPGPCQPEHQRNTSMYKLE